MTFWNFLRIKQEQYGAIKLIIVFMQVGLQKLKIHKMTHYFVKLIDCQF